MRFAARRTVSCAACPRPRASSSTRTTDMDPVEEERPTGAAEPSSPPDGGPAPWCRSACRAQPPQACAVGSRGPPPPPSPPPSDLGSFETYGWNPDDALSEDENLMDLVLLVTRTSQLREGGMACLLVEPPSPHLQSALPSSEPTAIPDDDDNDRSLRRSLRDRIAVVATNQSLYREAGGRRSSDVHAELVAVASAARRGVRTLGLAAYVTMPPCKACFPALAGAGIGRIVTRRPFLHAAVRGAADAHGVDLVVVPDTPEQRERVALLVELHRSRQRDS